MKDSHDKVTAEIKQLPRAAERSSEALPPVKKSKRLTFQEVQQQVSKQSDDDFIYRLRNGLPTYIPVSLVAGHWGVSTRRIRSLLTSGRLKGKQQENGYWEVLHPYQLTMGRRGPKLGIGKPKKPESKSV